MTMKFDWNGEGIRHTLDMLDRFTKAEIKEDLEKDPSRHAILIDPERNLYATSTSRDRYTTVWKFDRDNSTAIVQFTVPTQLRLDTAPEAIKEVLGKVLEINTHGQITLQKLGLVPEAPPAPPKPKRVPFTL